MINIILITIGTFIMALAGIIRNDDSKKLYFRKNFLLILMGIIFILSGTIFSAKQQTKSDNELIEALKNNSLLNEKIAKLSEKALSNITGGDSYIVVMPIFMSKERDYINFIVTSYGEYPLYDVKIAITDVDLLTEIENNFTLEQKKDNPGLVVNSLLKATYNCEIGNKTQGQGKILPIRIKLNHNALTKRKIEIQIFARNGIFHEKLRMKKVGNDWVSAYTVTSKSTDNSEKKTLFNRIDERYENVESDW